jgi:hypothetical protein
MRKSRALRYSLLGLLAAAALLVTLLFVVDLGRFKSNIESIASEALEREVAIDGDLSIQVGWTTTISADGIRIANAQGFAAEQMLTIGHFDASFALFSLLASPIEIDTLRIDRVRVNLETLADGSSNYTFSSADADDVVVESEPLSQLPVRLLDATVVDLQLAYVTPGRETPLRLAVQQFDVGKTDDDTLALALSGALNTTPLQLDASAGPLANLESFTEVNIEMSGALGEIRLNGEATIADLLSPRKPTARFEVSGPNAEYLTDVLQVPAVTSGPLDLVATIAPVGDQLQMLLQGTFGEFSLDTSGQFVDLQDLRELELRVAASGPDARTVARLFGNDSVPEDPFSIVGNVKRSGDQITVNDVKIAVGKSRFDIGGHFDEFPDPRSARAVIDVEGPDFGRFNRLLGLPGRLTGPFKLTAELRPLDDGGAAISLLAKSDDITLNMQGDVSERDDFVDTELEVAISGPSLRTITTALGMNEAPDDAFEISLAALRVADGVQIQSGQMALNDDRLTVEGLIGNAPLQADTDVQFELHGPNLAKTLASFGRDADELPEAPYRLAGRVERGAENFILHDVGAAIGDDLEYELNVDGELVADNNFVGTRLSLDAKGVSLGALSDAAGISGVPKMPFTVRADVTRAAAGIVIDGGDVRVGEHRLALQGTLGNAPLAAGTDLAVDAHIVNLKSTLTELGIEIEQLPPGALRIDGHVLSRNQSLDLRDMQVQLADTDLKLNGTLGSLPDLDGAAFDVSVTGPDLSRFLPENDHFSALNKAFGVNANVRLGDKRLTVRDADAFVGGLRAGANFSLQLEPMLESGQFSISAKSDDILALVPDLQGASARQQAQLDLVANGNWSENLWTIDELDMKLGEGRLVSRGTVDGPPNYDRTNLSFDWQIADVQRFSEIVGRELPHESAHLKFLFVGNENTLSMQEFVGEIGESDITGEFKYVDGDIPEVTVALISEKLNLVPYLPRPEERAAAAAAEKAESTAEEEAVPDDGRVIPDTPLPMDTLAKYRADVDVRAKEVILHQRTLHDFVIDGVIESGELRVQQFDLRSSRGEVLSGHLDLVPGESGAELLMALEGEGLDIGMPAQTAEELAQVPKYDIDTVLRGRGATLRELSASLDGYLRLVTGPGRLRSTGFQVFTGDLLSELLTTLNPFAATDPYSNLECVALLVNINSGLVVGEPAIILQSDRLRIFANADINLNNERLNVDIRMVPRKGLGLSVTDLINPYTKVSGTLASPTLTLDPEGAVLEGGVAVATGGLSILAKRFKDRFLSSNEPCADAVAATDADFAAIKDALLSGNPMPE